MELAVVALPVTGARKIAKRLYRFAEFVAANGMYTSFILLAVPLFIFAAEIMNSGSMTSRLLLFCDALVGRFRGGLAQVNVLQSIIFAGTSGSAIADAAGSGKLMQTMMTGNGKYTPSFAAALTAASSVIGPIIPPSIPMVVYALVADASIGYLFIAGLVPGLLMGLATIAIIARRRNFPVGDRIPIREMPRITARALPALMMPVVLLGFICSGVTTPTEAAAIAAAYAFLITSLLYREVTLPGLCGSLLSSARTTASIGIRASLRDIVRDTLPFLFAMLAVLMLITFVLSVALWLPRLLGYQG